NRSLNRQPTTRERPDNYAESRASIIFKPVWKTMCSDLVSYQICIIPDHDRLCVLRFRYFKRQYGYISPICFFGKPMDGASHVITLVFRKREVYTYILTRCKYRIVLIQGFVDHMATGDDVCWRDEESCADYTTIRSQDSNNG